MKGERDEKISGKFRIHDSLTGEKRQENEWI